MPPSASDIPHLSTAPLAPTDTPRRAPSPSWCALVFRAAVGFAATLLLLAAALVG